MQAIKIEKAKFYAYHGCMPEEASIGGVYYVDLEVVADMSEALLSDNLSHTIDYVQLYAIMREEMEIRSKLIEHVAERIMQRIEKECVMAEEAVLIIYKLLPPIGGNVESVSFKYHKKFKS